MATLLSVFLLLPLCLSVSGVQSQGHVQSPGLGENVSNDLIQQVCQKTTFPDICQETLSAVTGGSAVTLTDIVRVSLQVASAMANQTSYYTSGLLEIAQQPEFQQCVSQCSDACLDASTQLVKAIEALEAMNYDQVLNCVTAAVADSTKCVEGCEGANNLAASVLTKSDYFNKLCSNTLEIAKLLLQ